MPLQTRHIYKFGDFTLDATAKVVLRNGEPVRLARKAVETLLVLLEHPDQVLTKDELMEAIWRGRVVEEANLIQNIAVVRRTLQIPPGSPGYIETFPARGYRLVGPILEGEETLHGPDHFVTPSVSGADLTETPLPAPLPPKVPVRWFYLRIAVAILVAAGALWFTLVRGRVARYTRPENFRRSAVARLGGKEYQPAISADGKNVAFVLSRNDDHPSRIWIRAGQSTPITIAKEGWEYSSPVWSPDAKSLAYLRFGKDQGELVITSAEASTERVITTVFRTRFGLPNRHLDWSPDGKSLAIDETNAPDDPFGIFLVSLASGERRRLTTAPENALGDVDPRFSPDGKRLSFIRVFHRARQGLFTVESDGSELRQLSSDFFQVSAQDWTSDGVSIVFGSDRSGEFRLWRIPAAKAGATPVPDGTGIYGDAPIQFSIARRGRILLYSELQEDFNIWRLDLHPASAAADRWTPIVTSSAQDASPQYSPDGRQICFRSDRTGDEQLWISAADGSAPQQVTSGGLRPSVGRWSPDSRSIVFNNSREGDLYIAKRDGTGNWQTRPLGVKGTHPVFSTSKKTA